MLKSCHDIFSKTCDRVYDNLDSFFQGSSKRNIEENCLESRNDICLGYTQEWELNQGMVDIALKDVQGSICWLLPGFFKQFAIRLHQQLLLYFFLDTVFEDESSDVNYKAVPYAEQSIENKGRFTIVTQKFNEKIEYKLISISEWWVKLFNQTKNFLSLQPHKKTYYLLGYFGPGEYDYTIDNQNYMIRGPDNTNINHAHSFHIRN